MLILYIFPNLLDEDSPESVLLLWWKKNSVYMYVFHMSVVTRLNKRCSFLVKQLHTNILVYFMFKVCG